MQTQKHTQCFFQIAVMLNASYEYLPPHKAPTARHLSSALFPRAARALPANSRARKPVLDVQHRQPDPRVRAFPGEATRDQARGNLDDSGSDRLDYLCGAGVGCVLFFDTCARGWACGSPRCAEPGWDGSN